MAVTTNINTTVWDAMMRRLKRGGPKKIAVGIFGDGELAVIAATHEYGNDDGTIPERSYLRSTIVEKRRQINQHMKRVAQAMLGLGLTQDQALGLVGEFAVNAVKAKIRSNIPPGLKPATIDRKGSSIALIDTGRMLNSVTYKVMP